MTDTIYTSETPSSLSTDPAAATRSLGMRFTCSSAGMAVTSGRCWVPSTGMPATFLWQLWAITGPGAPVLLEEVDLNTLPPPTLNAWMPVPIAAPIPLSTTVTYVVNQFTSGGADEYAYGGGASFPFGSGGSISTDTALFDNDVPSTQPPADDSFTGGMFFVDVNVDAAPDIIAVGVASEQDFAQPVSATVTEAAGIASEQDFAQPVGAIVTETVGVASEQDHAGAVTAVVTESVGVASEQDFALPVAATVTAGVGVASEQDFAQPVGAVVSETVGVASEQDFAQPVAALVSGTVGVASEQDFALPVAAILTTGVGVANEKDHAQPVTVAGQSLGVANEQDFALPVGAVLTTGVGVANEKDFALSAQAGSPSVIPVGVASEIDHAVPVGKITPGQPNLAHLTWAIAKMLRDCLCTKLLETVAGAVCRCSLMAGDQAIADICESHPGLGNGQAWVRMTRLFVSREFPRPIVDTFNCAGGLWAAEFELGVLRCAVTPDDQGQPPSAQELNDEAAMVFDDAYALRITAECCIPGALPSIPGEWQPMASGGCTGGRVTVMVYLTPGPHELSPAMPENVMP